MKFLYPILGPSDRDLSFIHDLKLHFGAIECGRLVGFEGLNSSASGDGHLTERVQLVSLRKCLQQIILLRLVQIEPSKIYDVQTLVSLNQGHKWKQIAFEAFQY